MAAKSPFTIDDNRAQMIRERCGKFRILIIGRANAGKTTILQRTCDTVDEPVIYDTRGHEIPLSTLESSVLRGVHDIDTELVFKSNTGFCFHDSRGFESGGEDELEKVKAFISSRSKEKKLSDQVHAIWYCIPMDDSRPFTAAEEWFFAECGTGTVPVIAIFTKFDALDTEAYKILVSEGKSMRDASRFAPERAVNDFENMHLKNLYENRHPPKAHVYLRDMDQEGSECVQLIEKTAAALNNEVLQQLFVSTQRNSLELCMQYGIERVAIPLLNLHFKAGSTIKPDEVVQVVRGILGWFPQYKDHGYDDNIRLTGRNDESLLGQAADEVYSRLSSSSTTLDPTQALVHLAIVTVIVADFEYLLWNARYQDTLAKALTVYEQQLSTQVIVKAAKEALASFEDHGSVQSLSHQMLQITLENRLTLELLSSPVVTK